MSYNEEEELEEGFKMSAGDEDEPLDIPEDMDFGADDESEDPEDRYH